MNYRVVLYLLGRLQLALAVALVVPGVVSWLLDGSVAGAFFVSAAIAGAIGIAAELAFRRSVQHSFGRREAFLLVTAAHTRNAPREPVSPAGRLSSSPTHTAAT